MNKVQKTISFLLILWVSMYNIGFSQKVNDGFWPQFTFPSERIDVVIDTDTYNEIDDQFAVVYALLSPERLNVEAIYAAPFANSRSSGSKDGMIKSYEEINRLLDKLDLSTDQTVLKGSDKFIDENNGNPVKSEAVKDLIQRAEDAEDRLYVLTLGAPTNVSSAIMLKPEIIEKIVVIWLGGKGHRWPTAHEFNLKQDIKASQVLFDSGVPLIQLPTEPVTSHLLTTLPEIEHYLQGQNAIGNYLTEIYTNYYSDHFGKSKVIWDISAIGYLINPDWFMTSLVHSPILTDKITYSIDRNRHFIKVVDFLFRDKLFGDLFNKIQNHKTD